MFSERDPLKEVAMRKHVLVLTIPLPWRKCRLSCAGASRLAYGK
jgi:hypothetical protein